MRRAIILITLIFLPIQLFASSAEMKTAAKFININEHSDLDDNTIDEEDKPGYDESGLEREYETDKISKSDRFFIKTIAISAAVMIVTYTAWALHMKYSYPVNRLSSPAYQPESALEPAYKLSSSNSHFSSIGDVVTPASQPKSATKPVPQLHRNSQGVVLENFRSGGLTITKGSKIRAGRLIINGIEY